MRSSFLMACAIAAPVSCGVSAAPMLEYLEASATGSVHARVETATGFEEAFDSFSEEPAGFMSQSLNRMAARDGAIASVSGMMSATATADFLRIDLATSVTGGTVRPADSDDRITISTSFLYEGVLRLTEDTQLAVGLAGTSGTHAIGIIAGISLGFSAISDADSGFDWGGIDYPFVQNYAAGDYRFVIRVFLEGDAPVGNSGFMHANADSYAQLLVRIVPSPSTAVALLPLGAFASRRRR